LARADESGEEEEEKFHGNDTVVISEERLFG